MMRQCTDEQFKRYRSWFYAAAIYNLVWGALNVLLPNFLFNLIGIAPPVDVALWQVVGMFVLVYAPAYWWAGRFPYRQRHFIVIGLLGKILGPVGFVWSAATGQLPLGFGWILVTNDLIWWPAFGLYLREVAGACGGWRGLVLGE